MSDKNTHRQQIKKTVQQMVPLMDIDVTKMLSSEESAELQRQTQQRSDAVKLAKEVGREGLKARLKQTMMMVAHKEEDPETPEKEESEEETETEAEEEFEEEFEED